MAVPSATSSGCAALALATAALSALVQMGTAMLARLQHSLTWWRWVRQCKSGALRVQNALLMLQQGQGDLHPAAALGQHSCTQRTWARQCCSRQRKCSTVCAGSNGYGNARALRVQNALLMLQQEEDGTRCAALGPHSRGQHGLVTLGTAILAHCCTLRVASCLLQHLQCVLHKRSTRLALPYPPPPAHTVLHSCRRLQHCLAWCRWVQLGWPRAAAVGKAAACLLLWCGFRAAAGRTLLSCDAALCLLCLAGRHQGELGSTQAPECCTAHAGGSQ